MKRITAIVPDAPAAGDSVRLDHDLRNRRRMVFTTAGGAAILLDMARAVHLHDGDGLQLDDGSVVRVEAAPEALTEISAPDMPALIRIAWHLGNRHLPTQLAEGHLLIRHDHVIEAMVEGLGGRCRAIMAPFDPEGGAYAGAGAVESSHHHHGGHHHDH